MCDVFDMWCCQCVMSWTRNVANVWCLQHVMLSMCDAFYLYGVINVWCLQHMKLPMCDVLDTWCCQCVMPSTCDVVNGWCFQCVFSFCMDFLKCDIVSVKWFQCMMLSMCDAFNVSSPFITCHVLSLKILNMWCPKYVTPSISDVMMCDAIFVHCVRSQDFVVTFHCLII